MSRFRDVALLLLVLVIAAGLAFADTGLGIIKSDGTKNSFAVGTSVAAKSPVVGKYWDGLAETDYYNAPPYIAAPPNPQIAVGPDDILTVVNRTIARYPNPNASGASLVANPYNNPPTAKAWLDQWLGISNLATLCPSGTSNNAVCVIDNASLRYDQMQGRFVVVFTVTDVPAHRSNFVLVVSKYSQFTQGSGASSPVFTPPVIAPIVGGTSTGGVNTANWVLYTIPINLTYATVPTTAGTGMVATATSTVTVNGAANTFVTAANCGANGGPDLPLVSNGTGCTNYFPTGARLGLDNDNIILTAPVLDQAWATVPNTLPYAAGQVLGHYAGTRVVSISKMVVYNGTGLTFGQPPACQPNSCMAVNLADDIRTGTLVGMTGNPAEAGACGGDSGIGCIAPIFWEPNNLRGRALASFDAQVNPTNGTAAGVITPIDYLVGSLIPDNYGSTLAPSTALYLQPIVYSCPGSAIFSAPSGVSFCGVAGGGQIPDLPILGTVRAPLVLTSVGDPAPVGQAKSNTQPYSNAQARLFVGDSRPQQVIFREGLLYTARTGKPMDWGPTTALGTSTVIYDLLRTCATATGNSCGAYSSNGATFPGPALTLETMWYNGQNVVSPTNNPNGYGFYAPMFDVPADVVSNGPVSPINTFPWLEKLFVGMTTGGTANLNGTFAKNYASLWDFRPGDDGYDTILPYTDPFTGVVNTVVPTNIPVNGCPADFGGTPTQACNMIPWSSRGGAATDPNDGSLWMYGEFAKFRVSSVPGPGIWGTSVANYELDFPATDPYNNDNSYFADVQPGTNIFFTWIQIAKNLGIAVSAGAGTCPTTNGNTPIQQPPASGSSPTAGTSVLTCPTFGPATVVTRSEMARWVVLAQMDDCQVDTYLASTGGLPAAKVTTCGPAASIDASRFVTFADTVSDPNVRYIEVMARRGYTKGCQNTGDALAKYCPTDSITRGQMAVFLIRAKMNNVFPTTLSGIPLTSPYGDNFGLFQQTTPYFTDISTTDPFYVYIQKMRELRITNGQTATTYGSTTPLTRQEIATFIVRAFFL